MAVHVNRTVEIDMSQATVGQFDRLEVSNSRMKIEYDARLGVITLHTGGESYIEIDANDCIDALAELNVIVKQAK